MTDRAPRRRPRRPLGRRLVPHLVVIAVAWLLFGYSDGVRQSGAATVIRWDEPALDAEYTEGRWLELAVETRPRTIANGWLDLPGRHIRPEGARQEWEHSWRRAAVWAGAHGGVVFPAAFAVTVVRPGSAAEAAGLRPGDDVVAVNGWAVGTPHPSGGLPDADREVRLQVRRGAATLEIAWSRPADEGGFGFGFAESGAVPASWAPTTGAVGASAGLVHALAYLDAATAGDLTGGRVVAGTGVLYADGSLVAVDGLEYKLPAAFAAGADVVLVAGGSDLPDAYVGDPRVVLVTSADAALAWLCAAGGASPAC